MEKTAIIIHGACDRKEFYGQEFPAMSNGHWIPWLQKQLLIRGFDVHTPDMPEPYLYDYKLWRDYFNRYHLSEKTTLVGYSMGAGFLLRWLSENSIRIEKLVLVAPWLDPFQEKKSDFFDFVISPDIFDAFPTQVVYSTDDYESILATVRSIQEHLPKACFHEFSDRGHFFGHAMGDNGYPEILEAVTQEKIKWVK